MIYVTVGTMFLDFPRLVTAMDAIAQNTGERLVVQIGLGKTLPQHGEHFAFKPRQEVLALQREARVIVCHAGIGSVLDALHVRRPFIVVPRRKRFNEHMNDHQMDLAQAVQQRGWGLAVYNIEELPTACATPKLFPARYQPGKEPLVAALRGFLEQVAGRNAGRRRRPNEEGTA